MHVRGVLAALAVLAGASPALAAASFNDKAFVNAAGSLMTVDHLRAGCPAPDGALGAELATWERQMRAPDLRRALATARAEAGGEGAYATLNDAIARLLQPMAGRECDALKRWLAAPQARETGWTAGTVARAPPAPPSSAPARSAQAAPAAVPATAAAAPATRGDLQGYGLITQYGLGYGGMVTFTFEPVVLYRSGDMLKDLKGLANPAGVAADRQANPRRWTRWRQAGGVYEYVQTDGKWGKIYNNKVWSTPPIANLAGRYTTTGGGGNTAVGGTDAVFVQASYEFLPGNRLVRDGFASASSSAEGGGSKTTTVTGVRQGARSGRYTVDGLFMTIAYDDGARERVTFMTHPNDPDIVWINGSDYIRRTK